MSRPAGIPTLAVVATGVGLGGLSVAAAVFALEIRYSSWTVVGLAGGLLLPLLVVALVGHLLWSAPEAIAGTRWLGPAGTLLAALAAQEFFPERFEAEVKELRAAVAEWPNEGPRSDALEILDLCLAGKAVPEPG